METDVTTLTNTGMDSSIEKNSQQDMIEKKDQRWQPFSSSNSWLFRVVIETGRIESAEITRYNGWVYLLLDLMERQRLECLLSTTKEKSLWPQNCMLWLSDKMTVTVWHHPSLPDCDLTDRRLVRTRVDWRSRVTIISNISLHCRGYSDLCKKFNQLKWWNILPHWESRPEGLCQNLRHREFQPQTSFIMPTLSAAASNAELLVFARSDRFPTNNYQHGVVWGAGSS